MSLYQITEAVQPPLHEKGFDTEAGANTVIPIGTTSDNVVKIDNISREKMDKMGVDSHYKAAKAQETRFLDSEIVYIRNTVENLKGRRKKS